MKILIQGYNTFSQNKAGGVKTRISNFIKNKFIFKKYEIEVKKFNYWEDKIEDYDLVHFFKASMDHYNLMNLAKDKNKKIVISSVIPIEGGLKIKILLLLSKFFKIHTIHYVIYKNLQLSDMVLAQTEKEKRFITDVYKIPSTKIKVITNGISKSVLNGNGVMFRQKYDIYGDFVLLVGRVDNNKNQLNVIKAVKDTKVQLVIIGGPDPNDKSGYYEQCKQASLGSNNIKIIGWLNNENPLLAGAFSAAKVVILSSFKEIYGNCIYEGLANNCLVVYSNVLEITDGKLLPYMYPINPSDINNVRDVLMRVMQMNQKVEISDYVLQKYSWEAVIKEHIEVYKKVYNNDIIE